MDKDFSLLNVQQLGNIFDRFSQFLTNRVNKLIPYNKDRYL
jgi:hypothetical protein